MGCRRVAGPDSLERVTAGPDGSLRVGRTEPGRGAWLCAGSPACLERAIRRGALPRALRRTVMNEATDTLRVTLYGAGSGGTTDPRQD
ncbi:MAG: YlxR family protein [Actinomycetes bacterium]